MNTDLFIGRRPYAGQRVSIQVDFAAVAGQPLMRDTSNPAVAALATGPCLGFLTRDVVSGGPTAAERAQIYPGRLELADALGGQASLEMWDEVELEGSTFIHLSGTGQILADTARGAKITWLAGKAQVVQTGELAQFIMTDNSGLANTELTPVVAGNIRIRLERIIS